MEDWHESDCRRPDVILSADTLLSSCLNCGAVCIHEAPRAEDAQEDEGIADLVAPRPLIWPASVRYVDGSDLPGMPQWIKPSNFSWAILSKRKERFDSNPFEYDGLTGPSQIRILHLSPGRVPDALQGWLETVERPDGTEYEAVSYTWADEQGDKSLCKRIFLGPDSAPLPITLNCSMALRRLRLRTSARRLWIDSVCIDQLSPTERSHQVGLMREVYSFASRVQIYTGEAKCGLDRNGEETIHALEAIRPGNDAPQLFSLINGLTLIRDLEAFFSRPYFSRLWVVQEVILSKEAILHCGEASVKLTPELMAWLTVNLARTPLWLKDYNARESLHVLDLPRLLIATSRCDVADLRDKVFGLMGLIDNATAEGLSPDYSLQVREVYIGLAAYLIKNVMGAGILRLAGPARDRGSFRHIYGIPTWVPLWDRDPISSSTTDPGRATAELQNSFDQFLEAKPVLPSLLHGIHLSSVPPQYSSMLPFQVMKPSDSLARFQGWRSSRPNGEVCAATGGLVIPGYEMFDFVDLLMMDRDLKWTSEVIRGDPHKLSFFHMFPGGAVLMIQVPSTTNWAEEKLYKSKRVFAFRGCEDFILVDNDSPSAYRVLGVCQLALLHSPHWSLTVGQDAEAGRLRFLDKFGPLTTETLEFMYIWYWLLNGDSRAQLPVRSGPLKPLKRDYASFAVQKNVLSADYRRFINEDSSDSDWATVLEPVSLLLTFWQPLTISNLRAMWRNLSWRPPMSTFFNWLELTQRLDEMYERRKIFDSSQGPWFWSREFIECLKSWGEDALKLSEWLNSLLQIDLVVRTNGQYLVLDRHAIRDVSEQIYSCWESHSKLYAYRALSDVYPFASMDTTLMRLLFEFLDETKKAVYCNWLEEVMRYRRLASDIFCDSKAAKEIVLI